VSVTVMQEEQEGLAAQLAALPKYSGKLLGLLTVEASPTAGDTPKTAGTVFGQVAGSAARPSKSPTGEPIEREDITHADYEHMICWIASAIRLLLRGTVCIIRRRRPMLLPHSPIARWQGSTGDRLLCVLIAMYMPPSGPPPAQTKELDLSALNQAAADPAHRTAARLKATIDAAKAQADGHTETPPDGGGGGVGGGVGGGHAAITRRGSDAADSQAAMPNFISLPPDPGPSPLAQQRASQRGARSGTPPPPPPSRPASSELPHHLTPPPPPLLSRPGSSSRQQRNYDSVRAGTSESRRGCRDGRQASSSERPASASQRQQRRLADASRPGSSGERDGRVAERRQAPNNLHGCAAAEEAAQPVSGRRTSGKRPRSREASPGGPRSAGAASPPKKLRDAGPLGSSRDAAAAAKLLRDAPPLGSAASAPLESQDSAFRRLRNAGPLNSQQPTPLGLRPFSPPDCSGIPIPFRNLALELEEAMVAALQVSPAGQC